MAAASSDMNQPPIDHAWFAAQPFGIAMRDWLGFMRRVIAFNETVCTGIKAVGPMAAVSAVIGKKIKAMSDEQETRLRNAFESAKREIDGDFELVNALSLLAAWGSFEAFIEDVCKAMLLMDRKLLESKPFETLKLPAAVLVSDPYEQTDLVFSEVTKKLNSDLKIGAGKFECLLELVGLDGNGDVSDELKDAIFYAQQTPNVWAHRSGKADKRFVERCPNMGLAVGDVVKIGTEQNNVYLYALMIYGVLVVNRFLDKHNINPVPFPGNENSPFADPYMQRWGTMPSRDQPVIGWFAVENPTD